VADKTPGIGNVVIDGNDDSQVAVGDINTTITAGGDIVSGDKIVYGYTAKQVSVLMAEIRRADQPKTWDGRQPYIGLASFQETDAGFFFGREKLVDELLARVTRSRFVAISGPSGSGKSSLARAGLLHALRQGKVEGSHKWLLADLTPGSEPIEQMAQAIARAAKSPGAAHHIRTHGGSDPRSLFDQVETLLTSAVTQRCVILVDQFEEIFTQTRNEAERSAFIDLLTQATGEENGRLIVVVALRADFVSHCARYPGLRTLISNEFQLVGAMEAEELVRAITLPALEVGATIDPELVLRVIADMKGEPGALPLMQFALKDLFQAQARQQGNAVSLTLTDYLKRGGIYQTLERHADAAFSRLSPAQQKIARSVFSKMVEVGRGTADTRRTAAFSELVPADCDPQAIAEVVAFLAGPGVRLITVNDPTLEAVESRNTPAPGEAAGDAPPQTLTIAHEKLLDAWPWLRRLVAENRDAIALHHQIYEDAEAWQAHEDDESFLYAGTRLAATIGQLEATRLELAGLARDFVAESVARQKRKEVLEEAARRRELRRKSRIIWGLSTFVLILLLFFVYQGLKEWHRRTSPWQHLVNFPKHYVAALDYAAPTDERSTAFYCAGTLSIGIGCSHNGVTWNIYQQGLSTGEVTLGGVGAFSGNTRGISGLAIDPLHPDTIYAAVMDGYIYKSTNSGIDWQLSSDKLGNEALVILRMKAYDQMVAGVARLPRENTGNTLYVTYDGGQTWNIESHEGEPPFVKANDVYITPDGEYLYLAAETGVYRRPRSQAGPWQQVAAATHARLVVSSTTEENVVYWVAFDEKTNEAGLFRSEPDNRPRQMASFENEPIAVAVSAARQREEVYVLLMNSDIVAANSQDGTERRISGLPQMMFGQAFDLLAVSEPSGTNSRLLMAHSIGLLEYNLDSQQ
jgi:hypothetical protein